MHRTIVLAWMVAVLALPAVAEIYKWTDAQGKVQYSDQPPNLDAKGNPLKVQVPQGAEEVSRKAVEDSAKKAEKDALERKAADAKSEECKIAKSNLAALQGAGPVFRRLEKGGQQELGKDERQKELERAQESIKRACPP